MQRANSMDPGDDPHAVARSLGGQLLTSGTETQAQAMIHDRGEDDGEDQRREHVGAGITRGDHLRREKAHDWDDTTGADPFHQKPIESVQA